MEFAWDASAVKTVVASIASESHGTGHLDWIIGVGDSGVEQHAISSKFHVADVTRAVWSVGVICDAGIEAKFKADHAVVQKPDGTPVCHFVRQKGGLYIAKVQVRNPMYEGFRRPAR